jgi:hypothetical protein
MGERSEIILDVPFDISKSYDKEWFLSNLNFKFRRDINTSSDFLDFMESYLLPSSVFSDLKPIEGSIDFIKYLYSMNWKIIFCSKVLSYKGYPESKKTCLEKHLSDINYDLILVSDDFSKSLMSDADFIFDDSVSVARHLMKSSYNLPKMFMPVKPWNIDFLKNNPLGVNKNKFQSFYHFQELMEIF